MHGLICKSLEAFVRDQHGDETWEGVAAASGLSASRFEALCSYDDSVMREVFLQVFKVLKCDNSALLEDVGHWLCVHPPLEPVRRLIRFSGTGFVDLLYSVGEFHDRTRIALPGLALPRLRIEEPRPCEFELHSIWHLEGGAAVLTGVLRAMADDYGALAVIEARDRRQDGALWHETLSVRVFDAAFQEPRAFALGGGV